MIGLLSQRGQEAAPFELLIAVILMGFVILVGMQAMSALGSQKCIHETEGQLENMKSAIQTVVNEKYPQNVSFKIGNCFKGEQVQIRKFNEPKLCEDMCPEGQSPCTVLIYSNDEGYSIDPKCLNIRFDTQYSTQFQETGTDYGCIKIGEEFMLKNLNSEIILPGLYKLFPLERTESYPTVCAYYKP